MYDYTECKGIDDIEQHIKKVPHYTTGVLHEVVEMEEEGIGCHSVLNCYKNYKVTMFSTAVVNYKTLQWRSLMSIEITAYNDGKKETRIHTHENLDDDLYKSIGRNLVKSMIRELNEPLKREEFVWINLERKRLKKYFE